MPKHPATLPSDRLRRAAESKLRNSRSKRAAKPQTAAETLRLLHELQVHQLELEMQNEELLRSRAEAEEALQQYTELYDFAPVGYFTLSRDGVVRHVNLTGARMLGLERGRLVKRRLGTFVSAESRPVFNAFFERIFVGKGQETCELALRIAKDELLWAHVEVTCPEEGNLCHAVIMDITERKLAQEEIRRLSIRDALTGLYNRRFFEEELARLERGRRFPVSIVMADVDSLKVTNDKHGHAIGDDMLRRVAQILTAAYRADDVIARIGGDEFCVLLPGTSAKSAALALRRVKQLLKKHNASYGGQPISLSLGVSTATKQMALAEVLKEADAAMYHEKRGRDPA